MRLNCSKIYFRGILPLLAAGFLSACGAAEAPVPGDPAKPPEAGKVRVLTLEQEARGLPDRPPDEAIPQKLYLDPAGNRLALVLYKASVPASEGKSEAPAGGPSASGAREVDRRIVVTLSGKVPEIVEIWDADRAYRRTTKDLNGVQEDRDQYEAAILERLRLMSAADRKAILEENYIRPDGKRIVEVAEVTGQRKNILDHECTPVRVFENGRKVIDAWVAKDVQGAKSFYNLYRSLGAFSQQVLDRVSAIEGFPLEAQITVVTAAPAYTIGAKALSLGNEDVPITWFQIPPNYEEKKDAPDIVTCANGCGKQVETKEPGGMVTRVGRSYFFCSKKCQDKWTENLQQQGREERAKESAGR
jgi:YHS domain-containing protein